MIKFVLSFLFFYFHCFSVGASCQNTPSAFCLKSSTCFDDDIDGDDNSVNASVNNDCKNNKEETQEPWFTGPLLTRSAPTVEEGKVNTTNTYYNFFQYGAYNSQSKFIKKPLVVSRALSVRIFTGIAKNLDVGFAIETLSNTYNHKTYTGVGDCTFQIKHVLLEEKDSIPSLAAGYALIIPTGSYHNLDPEFETANGMGSGSWGSVLGIRLQKKIRLPSKNWFRWRLDLRYVLYSPVFIKGHSVYDTGYGAKGRANPGNFMLALLGMEYQITQNFVFAFDIYADHANKTPFLGYPGTTKMGQEVKAGLPSSEQYAIAPGLEYNFSKNAGIIFGVWFTIKGRNTSAFYTPMITATFIF